MQFPSSLLSEIALNWSCADHCIYLLLYGHAFVMIILFLFVLLCWCMCVQVAAELLPVLIPMQSRNSFIVLLSNIFNLFLKFQIKCVQILPHCFILFPYSFLSETRSSPADYDIFNFWDKSSFSWSIQKICPVRCKTFCSILTFFTPVFVYFFPGLFTIS